VKKKKKKEFVRVAFIERAPMEVMRLSKEKRSETTQQQRE
jgi:hypothetical protein